MKLILTGATGTIGGAVLAKAILEPAVAHIVVLSRRPVATITNSSKVTVLIVHDFMLYTEAELAQLDGADACIWCLGGTPDKYPDLGAAKIVNIEYSYTLASTLASRLSQKHSKGDKLLQFWYVSGHATVRDQETPLRLFANARKIKGEAENRLLKVQNKYQDVTSMHFARVGSVIPKNSLALKVIATLASVWYPAIPVDDFAAAMLNGVLFGDAEQIVTHEELRVRGRAIVKS